MDDTNSKVTALSSICLILLRVLRMERDQTQAQIADWLGKTPSAWTKIEAGKTPLSFEILFRWCAGMQVPVSGVLAAAERYAALIADRWNHPDRWSILYSMVEPENDDLLRFAHEYWVSPGFRNLPPNRYIYQSVLNGPLYGPDGSIIIAPVFQFALDPAFRESQSRPQSPF